MRGTASTEAPSEGPLNRRILLLSGSAAAAAAAATWAGGLPNRDRFDQLLAAGAGALFVLLAGIALRNVAHRLTRPVHARAGASAAHLVRMAVTGSGYLLVAFTALVLLRVPIGQLLLSGAVTGVILGIAAQQSLGNAFAGVILMLSAPFRVGDYITLRSGALGGQYDGFVSDISLTYTTLETDEGPMSFANAVVMAAATGRRQPPAPTADDMEAPAPEPTAGRVRPSRVELERTWSTRARTDFPRGSTVVTPVGPREGRGGTHARGAS